MEKVTILNVAERAKVSVATVSRVLNGNYPVSKEVRARVQEAIDALGYRPNSLARSLKKQHSSLVGVVVGDLTNMFFMQLAKGLESELAAAGYHIIMAAHEESTEKERSIVEMFLEHKVSSIVTTTCFTSGDYYASIQRTGVSVIFVDRLIDNYHADTVVEGNESSSRELVTYLLQHGHRRIAVVNGNLDLHTARRRYEGYLNAMSRYGIEPQKGFIVDGSSGRSYARVKELFQATPREAWPTAIFTTNNMRAEGTLRALLELGVRIPEEVSVVSYGDISMPWLFSLRLTHVDQNMVRIGEKTADLVLEKIKKPDVVRQCIIDSSVIYGNSVLDLSSKGRSSTVP